MSKILSRILAASRHGSNTLRDYLAWLVGRDIISVSDFAEDEPVWCFHTACHVTRAAILKNEKEAQGLPNSAR